MKAGKCSAIQPSAFREEMRMGARTQKGYDVLRHDGLPHILADDLDVVFCKQPRATR